MNTLETGSGKEIPVSDLTEKNFNLLVSYLGITENLLFLPLGF